MNEPNYPVTIAVKRPDGSVEQLRVGTAIRMGEGFQLQLGELSIGATADAPGATRAVPAGQAGGAVFPPYGRSKGAPVVGASQQDLEYYASGCKRTLADATKSRWHDKERVLLAAIEAEIARQNGGDVPSFSEDGPPPSEDIPF